MLTSPSKPCLPLPSPLRGSDPDSFAQISMLHRVKTIVQQVNDTNDFDPKTIERLKLLKNELPYGLIRPIQDPSAPDCLAWNGYVEGYIGRNWLEVPWLFAEVYLYRRILEATSYFADKRDPFAPQKQTAFWATETQIKAIGTKLDTWLALDDAKIGLKHLLSLSLWGNQADLSMFPTGEQPTETNNVTLVDDSDDALGRLTTDPDKTITFILDNAGLELFADLALADFLLTRHLFRQVVLHVKDQPYFVSDTMAEDIDWMLRQLQYSRKSALIALSERLHEAIRANQLQITTHPHWTSPNPHWQMPQELVQSLSQSALLISKGDLNYRRWLGDLHWPYSTAIEQIVCYTPSPLLLLRTLKSEIVAGVSAETIAPLTPNWMTSGNSGLIQLIVPKRI